jgi:hypothetical protein
MFFLLFFSFIFRRSPTPPLKFFPHDLDAHPILPPFPSLSFPPFHLLSLPLPPPSTHTHTQVQHFLFAASKHKTRRESAHSSGAMYDLLKSKVRLCLFVLLWVSMCGSVWGWERFEFACVDVSCMYGTVRIRYRSCLNLCRNTVLWLTISSPTSPW